MLELEDKLSLYGISIEDALANEEQYYEYSMRFTDNGLFHSAVSSLTQEIFQKFATGGEDEAKCAHHEIVALRKVVGKLKNYEHEFEKVQAIKESNVEAEAY